MERIGKRLTKLAGLVRERHPEGSISVSIGVWDWGDGDVREPQVNVWHNLASTPYKSFEEAFAAYERDEILFRKFK